MLKPSRLHRGQAPSHILNVFTDQKVGGGLPPIAPVQPALLKK
ncbi:hypothetical protein C4J94_5054 [Pseudomonas sp. R5-89-07]|nr:hypothetical protein C4J94_5054 [Pseudomonas sp. R5-89-07]